ncbi:MAG: hypothetical protein ACE1ZC_00300 [Nitrososphaerales archaeon]
MDREDCEFTIAFAELSYKIGKGEIKTKKEAKKFLEENLLPDSNIDDMYELIAWSLQDVLEDDKNPLHDESLSFPDSFKISLGPEQGFGPSKQDFDPSWN